jgi:cytochrome c oxidase subunit 3
MKFDNAVLTPDERAELGRTILAIHPLEEQYADLEHQRETATLGMWIFLVTEVLLFGVLFLGVAIYRHQYPEAFERGSEKLNWMIGGINTIVLLVSSLFMVLAVHYAQIGNRSRLCWCLALTASLGVAFLCLKGLEYTIDYQEKLIPGWRFDDNEWVAKEGLKPGDVPHVKLFLMFYWIMTALHGVHVSLGIAAVGVMFILARRGYFSPTRYTLVDVTALYWHFVDVVWIFLLPMLYLFGTHSLSGR